MHTLFVHRNIYTQLRDCVNVVKNKWHDQGLKSRLYTNDTSFSSLKVSLSFIGSDLYKKHHKGMLLKLLQQTNKLN